MIQLIIQIQEVLTPQGAQLYVDAAIKRKRGTKREKMVAEHLRTKTLYGHKDTFPDDKDLDASLFYRGYGRVDSL